MLKSSAALIKLIEEEFKLDPTILYLNHAAVAPWPARTAQAVIRFATENNTRGAVNYAQWLAAEARLKQQLQRLLNAGSVDDIALLKNTSEGLSIVACGIDWKAGENVVSSDEEFPSNRIPWQAQEVEFRQVNLGSKESPEAALIDACDAKTRLLTISSVQYANGRRIDLAALGRFCHAKGILFCVDAIQSLGVHAVDVQQIQADFVMADAHKWMLGPEGIAVFYCNPRCREQLQLHQYGWHMIEDPGDYQRQDWEPAWSARRFECGSPNMLGIHALSASLSLFEEVGLQTISRILFNKIYLIFELTKYINSIEYLSPIQAGLQSGIITFRIADKNMQELHSNLLKNKVICAYRAGGIRLSPHFYTADDIIYKAIEILKSII